MDRYRVKSKDHSSHLFDIGTEVTIIRHERRSPGIVYATTGTHNCYMDIKDLELIDGSSYIKKEEIKPKDDEVINKQPTLF